MPEPQHKSSTGPLLKLPLLELALLELALLKLPLLQLALLEGDTPAVYAPASPRLSTPMCITGSMQWHLNVYIYVYRECCIVCEMLRYEAYSITVLCRYSR
jgi:hypothetical protein